MRRTVILAVLAGLILLSICTTVGREAATADLVLVHGNFYTVDVQHPRAQALAVVGEKIFAVGSDAEIELFIGADTEVIDLEGMLAVPGLIEGHGHFMSYGQSLTELDLRYAQTWDEIVNMVAEAVRESGPGEWIVGRGWHQDKWERAPSPSVEGLPVHESLSAVSPNHPVLLSHTSGHGAFANARALDIAGIDRDTPNPAGGEIVRDGNGNAIGMLRENATAPVEAALARYQANRPREVIDAERREFVRLASEDAIRNGITSFQDMGSTFYTIDLLKQVASEGGLFLRLYIAIEEDSSVMRDKLADYRMVGYGGGYLTVRTIGEKVLDGALGTHGGWLLEPYTDLPRSVGFNVTPVEEIRTSAGLAMEHDYQLAIQGIGDRAVRELFDIYEESFREHPERQDLRWRIEHAQVVHPDDLPRFAELGVIPSIQGVFATSDGIWVEDRLGAERTRERGYVFRSMLESGAVVTNGTDPPVEEINPIVSFHATVVRQLPDGSLFHPEQTLTREQALRSYTLNNAYAAFEEDIKGSLTPGKLADITVLSVDIMTVPDDEIRSAEVVYTIIGGQVRYRGPGF